MATHGRFVPSEPKTDLLVPMPLVLILVYVMVSVI